MQACLLVLWIFVKRKDRQALHDLEGSLDISQDRLQMRLRCLLAVCVYGRYEALG